MGGSKSASGYGPGGSKSASRFGPGGPNPRGVQIRCDTGYELIYITTEAVGRVGYYQLTCGKSEKNNCFSKFSSNSLDFFG